MALSQTGITMSAVHCALGVITPLSSVTLSDLVKVRSINKWSMCKPIQHTGNALSDTYSGLTGVMATSKYGFELASAETENACLSLAASQTDLWAYQRWTPSASYPARLGDFRGYNHAAISPFQKVNRNYYVPGVEGYKAPVYEMEALILSKTASPSSNNYNANAEINPHDMFPGNAHKYAILYRKQGTNSTSSSTEVNMSNLTLDTGRLTGSTSYTGTFECCLAIHKDGDSIWYPCPDTYATFQIRNQTPSEYAGLSVVNQCQLRASSPSSKMYYIVKMTVSNITGEAIEICAGCTVQGSNTSRQPIWSCTIPNVITSSTPKWTIPAHSSITLYGAADDNQTLTLTDPGELQHEESVSYYGAPIVASCFVKNVNKSDVPVMVDKTVYASS